MKKRITALLLIAVLILACSACGQTPGTAVQTSSTEEQMSEQSSDQMAPNDSSEQTTESQEKESQAETTSGLMPAEISELAMENFVKKLDAGNYVVDIPKKVKTSVVSPEQAHLIYYHEISSYGYGFMTLNGETFEGWIEDDELNDVEFKSTGNVFDAMGSLLPNSWMTISDGNMFSLFYNNVEQPLEFTSKDENVKLTLLGLAGYNESALDLTHDVYMLLDAEDPSSVRFTAEIEDISGSMFHYDDLDITLEFGVAESEPHIEAWLSDPVFPAGRTGWSEEDIYTLDNVFLRDYGADTVPFPEFASYAMKFDPMAYMESSMVILTDPHADEKDLEDYISVLLSNGYEEVAAELEDGSSAAVYRRPLREEYRSYAQLYPYYDNGFVLEGSVYYDNPVYDGLQTISDAVQQHGFAAFDETDIFSGWNAEDMAGSRSEGWAYFFDYDMYMPFILGFADRTAAMAYLENYGNRLVEKGFSAAYSPGQNSWMYTSPNDFVSFRYTFNEDDTVTLEFKNEKSLTPEEVSSLLREHGLPETDIHGDIGGRDHTRYHYIIGEFRGLFLMVYQPFESTEAAESYLDSYSAELEAQGYEYFNPEKVGSYRQFVYLNEELSKYVGFDLIPGENSATIFFEFVSIEPEDVDLMQSLLGHRK